MKRHEVVLAPAAQTQARKVAAWWRENRPKARELFDDEMAAVLDRLAEAPKTGLSPRHRLKVRPSAANASPTRAAESSSTVTTIAAFLLARMTDSADPRKRFSRR